MFYCSQYFIENTTGEGGGLDSNKVCYNSIPLLLFWVKYLNSISSIKVAGVSSLANRTFNVINI